MPPTDQLPRTHSLKPPSPSKVGRLWIRLALKTCSRWIPAGPQSRPRSSGSVVDVGAVNPPSAPATLPLLLKSDQVYDAWNCEPRPKRVMYCVWIESYSESPLLVQ